MPKNRPGRMQHNITATKAVRHGKPYVEEGRPGVAVKIKDPGYTGLFADRDLIAIGEKFHGIVKGEVEVDFVAGFARGDKVYIVTADNTLTETVGTNVKFGIVTTLAGERGCPPGKCRIDLDAKDQF